MSTSSKNLQKVIKEFSKNGLNNLKDSFSTHRTIPDMHRQDISSQ